MEAKLPRRCYNASIMEEILIPDATHMTHAAKRVLSIAIEKKERTKAVVLALHGDLGAGKTTFVQALASALQVQEAVTSPTFVIMKQYPLVHQPFTQLVHIDAYRIEDIDEMRVLGFEELLREKGTIMCIEWAEHIEELLPPETIHLSLDIHGEERLMKITHGNT